MSTIATSAAYNVLGEPFCMLCDHLSPKSGAHEFRTDHSLEECHRCSFCSTWCGNKKGGLNAHRKKCTKLLAEQKKVDKKIVPKCRHWARGECFQGDKCNFRHSDDINAGSARQESGVIVCFGCGENHHIRDCHAPCNQCGNKGHTESRCIQCFRCEEWGHHIKACPLPCGKCGKAGHSKEKCIKCFRCEEWGHHIKACAMCEHCDDLHRSVECPFVKH